MTTNNTPNLYPLLYKNRKFIIIFTLLSGISGMIISYTMPKKYQATAVVYPTSKNSMSEVIHNPEFGHQIHTDRLIQLFNSQRVMDSIINKFQLINFYKLDTSQQGWQHKLTKKYYKMIEFNRTKHLSVTLRATTTEPKLSMDILNYCLRVVNEVQSSILKENIIEAASNYKKRLEVQKLKVDSLLNEINEVSLHPNSRNPLRDQLITTIEERNKKGIYTPADARIKKIASSNYDAKSNILINDYLFENEKLTRFKKDYDATQEKISTPLPSIYVISYPKLDDQKVSPSVRTNTILSLIFGFFAAVFVILIGHKFKQVRNMA